MTSVAYVLPTHNRAGELTRTLDAISRLPPHDAEVIVVDNASNAPPPIVSMLANRVPTRVIRLGANEGAAARNAGARCADADWIIMLDDDSSPLDLGFLRVLDRAPRDVLAISADIRLSNDDAGAKRGREAGGLPEVFIGCGVAIRRDAFLKSGGYDPTFHYYAEEYDLAARLLLMGGRVTFSSEFRVEHRKVSRGRDMDTILGRLVRNTCWVEQRYAPDAERFDAIVRTRRRYRAVARTEHAQRGFAAGLRDLRSSMARQPRTPMRNDLYDRFTGLSHARDALSKALRARRVRSAALVDRGKNDWAIERALDEIGVPIVDERVAEALVIATLSPGPMLDALERRASDTRIVAPWIAGEDMPRLAAA